MISDRMSVLDTIRKDGKFSTFASILQSSKSEEMITGNGPFTVFAPTNEAFKKVSEAQMTAWEAQPDQTDLAKIVSYHVVGSKKLFASKLGSEGPAASMNGTDLTFSDLGGLKVNEAKVQSRNIEATNGIIHALDTVLTPPASEVAVAAAAAGAAVTAAPVSAATPTTSQADGDSDAAARPAVVAATEVPATATPSGVPKPITSNIP